MWYGWGWDETKTFAEYRSLLVGEGTGGQIYTVVIVLYSIWVLFMVIVMIIPSKSTGFFTVNFQRIFSFVT